MKEPGKGAGRTGARSWAEPIPAHSESSERDTAKARWAAEWAQLVRGLWAPCGRDQPAASYREGPDPFSFPSEACPRTWRTWSGGVRYGAQAPPFPSCHAFRDACPSSVRAGADTCPACAGASEWASSEAWAARGGRGPFRVPWAPSPSPAFRTGSWWRAGGCSCWARGGGPGGTSSHWSGDGWRWVRLGTGQRLQSNTLTHNCFLS